MSRSVAASIAAFAAFAVAATSAAAFAPTRPCDSLTELSLPNTTVDSAQADPGDETTPASCRVHVSVTHPPEGDDVNIDVYMPVAGWNGRFQGVGGGGFSGGSPESLLDPLRDGYAAGSTDAGHEGSSGSFALNPDGTLNWQRIRDFGYLGIHEMTVAAKALVKAYYGRRAHHSYFNGCSTGGRQGLMEAQRYPADYDGIMAGAPAINWQRFHIAQLWGQTVMLLSGNPVPMCKFEAATAAAVEACDRLGDDVADGVIGDPLSCEFDPAQLVGMETPCGTITEADAEVIRRIWEGPRRQDGGFLWYGLPRGGAFAGLHNTAVVDGELVGQPFPITLQWFSYWLNQDPGWDWRTISYDEYERLYDHSVATFSDVIGTDNPDLSAFRHGGGKVLVWHGLADWGIFPQGTVDYYRRVLRRLGGPRRTGGFIRLFLAPGVGHCGGGEGPAPEGQFEALVRWVERDKAPRTLDAVRRDDNGNVIQTRPLCLYPRVARYTGRGDVQRASSFRC